MSITTDFDALWVEKKQRDSTVEAKALLQNCMMVVEETKARIQAIVDVGVFNTIPLSIKTALQDAFLVVKNASTGFNTVDVKEVLDWAGK